MRVSAAVLVSVVWATLAVGAGAMSVSAIVQGVCAPLAGVVADRFGSRPVIAFLAAIAFSGCGVTCFWLARRPAP